jgi:hypothetical protein
MKGGHPMTRLGFNLSASQVVRGVLIAGLLFMLGASLPGHLSYDSLAQLHEGRTGVRATWGPTMYAWLLGAFDEVIPGTGLYVIASASLLFFSLSALRATRPQVSWWAVPLTVLLVFSPIVLIYQAIVWKDVLFANLAIAGFVCLARLPAAWDRPGPRWLALGGAMLALAMAALVRQNGVVVVVLAAMSLGAIRFRDGWRQALIWGFGGLVATLVLMQVLGAVAQPKGEAPGKSTNVGLRILQHYDIVGAVARDPNYPLSHITAANPAGAAAIRKGVAVYSPQRVDFFDADPTVGTALWHTPKAAVRAEWRELITKHPGAYIAQRGDVFRWLVMAPKVEACLPDYVGVSGPEALVADLKLTNAVDPADWSLHNYATYFYGTPVFSHLAYALIALVVAGVLLWRRGGADLAIAGLMLSAVAFAGSFFVISIACDYRYLYFLDIAAMTGLFYLVLDPSLRRAGPEGDLRSDAA